MNWMRRPARLLRPTLFLMVLIIVAGAASAGFAQQSAAVVCHETGKVHDQLVRENEEAELTRRFIQNEEEFRKQLSALNKGIANGRVEISGADLEYLIEIFDLEKPGATAKERLAFQKTVRPLVQRQLQVASATNIRDVEARIARLEEQIFLRKVRWSAFDCENLSTAKSAAAEMVLLGCFKDSNRPFDLDGFLERSSSNTPESCVAKCRAKGFAYAGVQYGQSCLCGNSYGKQGTSSACNMKCTGDSSKICGGLYCNSVYATGVVPK